MHNIPAFLAKLKEIEAMEAEEKDVKVVKEERSVAEREGYFSWDQFDVLV